MIENVYFVESLHGIQYFLSLCKAEQSNLIVMGENRSLHQFIQDIMPNERKITIPRIPRLNFHPYKLSYYFSFFWLVCCFLFWRIYYTRFLKEIRPPAKAFFFARDGSEHFYIVLGYLARRGVQINYVDALSANYYAEPIEEQRFRSRLYLWFLGRVGGIQLARFRARLKEKLGLVNCFEPMPHTPDSWQLLSKKYRWNYRSEAENAILVVDRPIQAYRGVNVEKTQQNLIRFFSEFLGKGVQIHLKPHYSWPAINSFSGTNVEEKIKILPRYFPVELIMNQYQEVYLFTSASGSIPIEGKKYSLARLVVFDSKDEEDTFWKICEDNFGEEIAKVEFVVNK
ncbi:MAG: hypothetical protein ACE5NG_21225 [bacterium]